MEGKVCVITGSASGIGLAIAKRMGLQGAKVVISSRNQKHIEEALAHLRSEGIQAEGIVCHVAKDRKKLVEFAVEKFGGIDVLVCNAAISTHFGPTIETTEESFDKMIEVNLKATFLLIKESVPFLEKGRQPSVLIVSSIAGYNPNPLMGIYSVTKSALISLTKILGTELAGRGIRVNAIAPGIIKTKLSKVLWDSPEASNNPIGRIGYSEDCAGAALFLCSENSSFITGETIVVAGGTHARL